MEAPRDEILRTLQVMVVEDDLVFRRYMEAQLEMLGCQIVPMDSADVAWERIQAQPPDLVLTDVFMPGMNGFELCRRIKSSPGLHDIPVVLLTMAGPKAKDEGYQAGADDFLNKPPHLLELRTRLHHLLLLRSLQTAVRPEPVEAPVPELPLRPPRILVLESYGILREHVRGILAGEGLEAQGVDRIERFLACLEMETPDMVIIDQDLLEGPGSALVARLRSQAATTDLAILLMCDPGVVESGNGTYSSEADEHLVKPFEASELRARVRALLRHSELRNTMHAQHLESDVAALKDPRSGAFTRPYLYAALDVLCAFASQCRQPMGLLGYRMLDAGGARPGGARRVAGLLRSQLRPHEILCRVGEEDFVAVLPGVDSASLVARVDLLASRLPSGRFAVTSGWDESPSTLLRRIWNQLSEGEAR